MTAIAEPVVDNETTLLEDLDFDHTPKCDNDTCDNDATHMIRCHCQGGTEYSCLKCINDMQDAAEINPLAGMILFDGNKSCGHQSFIFLCTISPL